jgi:hypothetical protein
MTGLKDLHPSGRHNMSGLDDNQSIVEALSQDPFKRLRHVRRGFSRADGDHAVVTSQIVPAPADGQEIPIP